nr:hypothetical protein [Candidatus Sigynarchaeota archaeon]
MAEEFKKPPLQEIPSRPLQKIPDGDADLVNLVNSIKESLNVKMIALRKDLDLTIHDQIANEMARLKEEVQDLIKHLQSSIQGEARDQIAGTLEELKVMHETLNSKHGGLAEATSTLSRHVTALAGRVEELASMAKNAVPASDIAQLRQEVSINLEKTQALVSSFDLPLFINEIRDAFSTKVALAETRTEKLAKDLEHALEERSRLLQDLDTARARLETTSAEKERVEKDLKETKACLGEEIARLTTLLEQKTAEIQEIRSSRVARQETPSEIIKNAPETGLPARRPAPAEAGNKIAGFCYNCGKPRTGISARFCTFCGEDFQK